MPLERFYRLAEEKQKAIRKAVMKEFSSVPIDKVSINKIIKDADISRGSFYTYFENKWDMLGYIFEDGHKKMKRFCVDHLDKNGGDIWDMMIEFLDHSINFISNNDTFEFIKNVMEHSSSEEMFGGFASKMKPCDGKKDELEIWLFNNTDLSEFISKDFEEFHRFLSIAMSCMAIAMREFYQGEEKEVIMAEFTKKLELLRHGVCSG